VKADSPQVRVQNVFKSYVKGPETISVLRDTSFDIFSGDMISITGKSGAGKSTLLHVLGTLDSPDSGDILYQGNSLTELSPAELADFRNRQLGFVFQFHHLLPEFTAIENVMMPALIRRIPKSQAEEMANKAIQEVGLGHRLGHKPGELSGGEQQRVALARALVLDPPLLLADEVTGNLDAKTGGEIHELLQGLNQTRGITIVVVTHSRILAEKMNRRLVLDAGSVKERE